MTEENFEVEKPLLFENIGECKSWDEWLDKTEIALRDNGYRKYNQNIKNEDFTYWKTFYVNDEKAYQVGLLFYDFRKHMVNNLTISERIGVQFECMFIDINSRIDLTVSKNITLLEFEAMSKTFYDSMFQYTL